MSGEAGRTTEDSKNKSQSPIQKEEEVLKVDQPAVGLPSFQIGAGDNPPTLPDVSNRMQKTWGQGARQRSFAAIQRVLGNRAASRVAVGIRETTANSPTIQLHGKDEPVLENAPDAVKDVERARSGSPVKEVGPAAEPAAPGPEAGPAPEPAAPGPEAAPEGGPAAPGPEAAPEAEPAAPGPEAEPAAEGEAEAAPTPVLAGTMSTAFAQQAIADSFGEVAGDIVPGNITVVADQDALYAAYDQWCIDNGVTHNGSAWAAGDKAADDDAAGVRMNAFAEPEPGTNIWVDSTGTDPTATVHEMLHINTASGFRAAVGEIVNEGTTQRLAVKAVTDAGSSAAGSEFTYQDEQEVVEALVDIVTEPTLISAYFGGAATLTSAYNTAKGDENAWTTLKALLDANDFTGALALIQASTETAEGTEAEAAPAAPEEAGGPGG